MMGKLAGIRWNGRKALVLGLCIGAFCAVAAQAYYILLGGNFHTVLPGLVYRSAQPSTQRMEQILQSYRIRTIINLRGDNVGEAWYHEEIDLAKRLGVRFVDVGIWGTQPAPVAELRLLVDAIQPDACPIFLHCCSGADRTGIASALALLLLTDASIDEARGQLALRFGHTGIGGSRCHHLLLNSYQAWLNSYGLDHAPEHLRRWVRDVYRIEDLGYN